MIGVGILRQQPIVLYCQNQRTMQYKYGSGGIVVEKLLWSNNDYDMPIYILKNEMHHKMRGYEFLDITTRLDDLGSGKKMIRMNYLLGFNVKEIYMMADTVYMVEGGAMFVVGDKEIELKDTKTEINVKFDKPQHLKMYVTPKDKSKLEKEEQFQITVNISEWLIT